MASVFIGPWCAGKSTLAPRYAAATGSEFIDLDDLTPGYGAEIGWSLDELVRRNHEIGMLASEHEWEHVRVHAVERVLADFPNATIALGASYTSYTDESLGVRASEALSGHRIILVCPDGDDAVSSHICRARAVESRGAEWVEERRDFPSWCPTALDRRIADATVFTGAGTEVTSPDPDWASEVCAALSGGGRIIMQENNETGTGR